MSATSGLAKQESDLNRLLKIANLNPQNIAAAAEETRKQLVLTQEQEGKVAEALAYIAKHKELATDIQRREDELAANKAEHEKSVSKFNDHVASENIRLETFAADLTARENNLNTSIKNHETNISSLNTEKANHAREYKETMESLQRAEASNTAVVKTNEAENTRLAEWESTLKRKAQALREQAASF